MKSGLVLRRPLLIGVIHLKPLPGAPRFGGSLEVVVKAAAADAQAYERGGADAVFIENFGDTPFFKAGVGPETVAAMTVTARAVRDAIGLPVGFNVLRNDARAALALCAACGGSFIRVNIHAGAMLTDQGVIEGDAAATLRLRRQLCPDVKILADVHVKHAVPLGNQPIEIAARDTLERGLADALIVSGTGTGQAAGMEKLERVRQACRDAWIFIGSGVTTANVREYLRLADGVITGTSLKKSGVISQPVDARRVAALARRMRAD